MIISHVCWLLGVRWLLSYRRRRSRRSLTIVSSHQQHSDIFPNDVLRSSSRVSCLVCADNIVTTVWQGCRRRLTFIASPVRLWFANNILTTFLMKFNDLLFIVRKIEEHYWFSLWIGIPEGSLRNSIYHGLL